MDEACSSHFNSTHGSDLKEASGTDRRESRPTISQLPNEHNGHNPNDAYNEEHDDAQAADDNNNDNNNDNDDHTYIDDNEHDIALHNTEPIDINELEELTAPNNQNCNDNNNKPAEDEETKDGAIKADGDQQEEDDEGRKPGVHTTPNEEEGKDDNGADESFDEENT